MLQIKGDTVHQRFKSAVAGLKLKFPIAKIAELTGYGEPTVSAYINKKEPSEKFLRRFSEVFNLSFEEIWNESESEAPPAEVYKFQQGNSPTIMSLAESNRILSEANKIQAEANKALSEAHLILARNAEDLVKMIKITSLSEKEAIRGVRTKIAAVQDVLTELLASEKKISVEAINEAVRIKEHDLEDLVQHVGTLGD